MPRLRSAHPTMTLEQVEVLVNSTSPAHELVNFFGIFKKESQQPCGYCWTLFDESKEEIDVVLNGKIDIYIKPKFGDIVRIHRAKINTMTKKAEIPVPQNVVVWSSFEENPKPKTVAKQATIDDDDEERSKALQIFFISKITRVREISLQRPGTTFLTLAGRVEAIITGAYGQLEVSFNDGTGKDKIRIFNKISPHEDDIHFKTASNLKIGQYFIANNVKYDRSTRNMNLSANQQHGRAIRPVDRGSNLGLALAAALKSDTTPKTSITPVPPANNIKPEYTALSDISPKGTGYEFYNIAGQIRTEPAITTGFENCILQLYDGSQHSHQSYFQSEVERVMPGCVLVQIYSKQRETDTSEHCDKAKSLKEGDLVLIKNVKTSFIGDKIKLELQANTSHNKSISKIDKESPLGNILLNIVENPLIGEQI